MQVRKAAIECLNQVRYHANKADVVMQQYQLHERKFLHELLYGALRYSYSLEADFSRFCKTKPDDIAYSALAIGTYQLRHMRVPKHAAVSETVAAMQQLNPKAAGFVNAVLRRVSEHEAPKKLKPNQRTELPKWMYASWRDAFGGELVQSFCVALKQAPMLSLAVFTDRDEWIAQALEMGIDAEVGELSPYAVLLPVGTHVTTLPGFAAGAFTVMDQAAQAAVIALDANIASDHPVILDVCAAPGGKTALLAHHFPQARVIAIELSNKRLPRLQENILRLQLHHVDIIQANAMQLPFANHCIDAIFLDAPCSASGILRRHPDAKFLHDVHGVEKLSRNQSEILQASLRVLKKNEQMVYGVCSIHPQENEQVLEQIDHEKTACTIQQQTRLYPHTTHDGFFYASIKKHE